MKQNATTPALLAIAIALTSCAGHAPMPSAGIAIDHTVLAASNAQGVDVAAYAGFDNRGGPDRLLGADCACAAKVELHRVASENGKMTMSDSFPLALPGGSRVEVKPPGIPLHLMLIGTTRPFAPGEKIAMRLRFERAGDVQAVFTVAANSRDGWAAWSPD